MNNPRCPYCGSENITDEYQLGRNEYSNFIKKDMGERCLDCGSTFRLVTGWVEGSWFIAGRNGGSIPSGVSKPWCPKCMGGRLWMDEGYSDDMYDVIERTYTCECDNCGERSDWVQQLDLSWWEAQDLKSGERLDGDFQ